MASLPQVPLQAASPRPGVRPAPEDIARVRRRRRPSGEPPPLPRHLAASGKWWLGLSAAVVLLWAVGLVTGSIVVVDLVDTGVLQAISEVRSPGLTRVAEVAGGLATPAAVKTIWLVTLVVLVASRRWRHLLVWLGICLLVPTLSEAAALTLQRPRPYGVEILGPWSGFAMPSVPITVLTASLVSVLYALVPAGRWRTVGKWVVVAALAVTAASRLYLAQDHPTDVLAGVVLGVAAPLAAFRLLTPNEVYPVRYSRGSPAHLDVTGGRGRAIVRALQDQLGLLAMSVQPFNLAGSGGSTPLRIGVKSDDADG